MKRDNKLTWNDIRYWQFKKLQETLKDETNEEAMFDVAAVIYGDEVLDLPLGEFTEKVRNLAFLKDEIPTNIPPKKVTVNGKKYYIDCLLGNITTSQYIDFTNYSKTNDTCKMVSVFLIPEGHKYNDGYDMLEVFKDIEEMPITVVNDISFFLSRQFSVFIQIFQRYSIKSIRKLKMPKEIRKKMEEVVKKSVDMMLIPLE